jgi:hypothetical protein
MPLRGHKAASCGRHSIALASLSGCLHTHHYDSMAWACFGYLSYAFVDLSGTEYLARALPVFYLLDQWLLTVS